MKLTLLSVALFGVSLVATASPIAPVSINVTKHEHIDLVKDVPGLKTYAGSYGYYFEPHLHEGMRVMYSASYGIGAEEAQARGTVVQQNGHFYFKQSANPSENLLLPPGLSFNASNGVSLWDLGDYMALINRVAFSEPNKASATATDVWGAAPDAYKVDFEGGTAGDSVQYKDAMEVNFTHSVGNRSESKLQIYYAKGVGPVALEFREDMEPACTFKFYLGE